MKLASLEALTGALNAAGVRYLIAGGLAVNAHGYVRFTHDVDLIIQPSPENITPAFAAFASLGYRPMVSVTAEQFSDPVQRQQWIADKHMMVLNLQSDRHRETPVDIFITEPFDFDAEYRIAPERQLAPGLSVRFVSIPALIAMKEVANRPRDVDDIQHLRWLVEEQRANYPNT